MYFFCRVTFGMTKKEFFSLTLREYLALKEEAGPKEDLAYADDIL